MARTKRKVNPVLPVAVQAEQPRRIYQVGGYARLSVEDSGKPGADTISTQRELIQSYIDGQPDMRLYDLYCDNGRTGTNFDRPEFERMMEDVRSGKVDCIVVKDLSRFGRNYRETGNYLERIFPLLDVRFIAVNDNFDTLTAERTQDGYIVPLKNIMNAVYSKDISRKILPAISTKQQKGEFGRDYLTVGNYISCVFPFLGVRFIAVNDGFDSIRPTDVDSLETSFKALLYDLYSRDLSRKVRSAKKFRAQRGDFLAPFAPYGYVKDPADKARLVIDPEAAETVRRVFHLAASGHSADQIAMALNRETVPTPMLYKRAAGCSRTRWPSIEENNFWTDTAVVKILRDERYFGKNIFGKRIRDRVGHTHTVKVSREDWIAVENTHEGIVTREEFDRAQTAMREFVEHGELKKRDWPLRGKVRCGVCGHAMSYKLGKQMYFYCYTPRYNDSFACVKQVQGADILEVISDGLRVQAQMAVELSRLWEEQHREQKKDAAAVKKNLAGLRETHQRLSQQISGLYESFALGEIGKPEYLAAKTAAAKQRDDTAARISELEAALENMGADGSLRNGFVSTFGKYLDVKEITSEITAEVLKEVLVFPGDRFEIAWNYRDELEKLILDLQGEHQNGA